VDKKFVEVCHSYLAEIPVILVWQDLKQHVAPTISSKVQKVTQQHASVWSCGVGIEQPWTNIHRGLENKDSSLELRLRELYSTKNYWVQKVTTTKELCKSKY
jgi:hypothetical protein